MKLKNESFTNRIRIERQLILKHIFVERSSSLFFMSNFLRRVHLSCHPFEMLIFAKIDFFLLHLIFQFLSIFLNGFFSSSLVLRTLGAFNSIAVRRNWDIKWALNGGADAKTTTHIKSTYRIVKTITVQIPLYWQRYFAISFFFLPSSSLVPLLSMESFKCDSEMSFCRQFTAMNWRLKECLNGMNVKISQSKYRRHSWKLYKTRKMKKKKWFMCFWATIHAFDDKITIQFWNVQTARK